MALRISKQLPSGWPQLTPAWPLTHWCITLWSGVLSAKFGGHRAFLKNLTSGWPWLTPAWPLTQQWVKLWSRVLPTKFGGHMAFLSNLTSGWPWLTLHDLWPQQCITLWSGVLPTKFGGHRALLSKLTPADPYMTFDPNNALHSGQEFLPSNLVAIGHCWANWPLFDPSWPLHDIWPQQYIMLWSGVLLTKFGGHRVYLSKLTPTWPQLTPTWPLTPAMHYTLVRGSSHQIWQP